VGHRTCLRFTFRVRPPPPVVSLPRVCASLPQFWNLSVLLSLENLGGAPETPKSGAPIPARSAVLVPRFLPGELERLQKPLRALL
jgi:hypothetical protein